jgi:membrane protein YdbS with pleckstrin-like domain
MFDPIRNVVLKVTRVPAQPHPPLGAAGSVRVFRAGRNFYKLCLLRWGVAQFGAIIGIIFSLYFLHTLDQSVAGVRTGRVNIAADPRGGHPPSRMQPQAWQSSPAVVRTVNRGPLWLLPLLHWAEYGAILLFLCQIPVTYAAARLEFEQHWYIVTDRSLRIRRGLLSVQETTMSFANLQQVEIQQGPLQRLLGLANLRVQSAGGGGAEHEGRPADSLHTGIFQGVENAAEIRDLILERLRRFRESGLGDPDDQAAPDLDVSGSSGSGAEALGAAREVLSELRALRRAIS